MKQINQFFDDAEHRKLVKAKGSMNWHDFIMTLVKENEKE